MSLIKITILCLASVDCGLSQNHIHGTVTDIETGEPLSYANIYIENTYIGTTSNKDGDFSLKIKHVPSTIIVSYIGYRTRRILIDEEGQHRLDVQLNPIVLELGVVVVTADQEDPAIGIMKKVIANKINWKRKLKSYRAKAYTRTKIENDTSIVSISESVSRLYWDQEKGAREEFIAKKSSKQMPYLTELNVGSKNIVNFSDDDVSLLNHAFMGPTHPRALNLYDFKLKGERPLDNKIVYDIQIRPKSRLQPLFIGRISVLDEDFVVIDVDLKNSGNMCFSEMLKYFYGSYRQQFSNFGRAFWLPIHSRVEEAFEVDMGLMAFPRAIFNKISRISNYEVNVDVAEAIARLDTASAPSISALRKNILAFDDFEKIPLRVREQAAYRHPDTTMTLMKSFRPTGLLARYMIGKEDEIEASLREHSDYSVIRPSTHWGFQAWYNRVEGLNVGLKMKRDISGNFQLAITGGYQTHLKKGYYDAELKYFLNLKDKSKFIFARYYDQTDTRYRSTHYSQMVTSILPLLGVYDYFDYFSNKKLSAGFRYGVRNTEMGIELSHENHSSISNKTDWSLLGKNKTQRPNPSIDKGRLNTIKLQFDYDETLTIPTIAKTGLFTYNKVSFQIEHASKNLGSDFHFTRYTFMYDYALKTFFRRRSDWNCLRTRVEASTHTGEIPLQRFSIIDGSLFSYTLFGIFKTRVKKPLEGEKKLAFFWEYNFKSIPFELLRLKYFTRAKWEFLVHGALGRTWIDESQLQSIRNSFHPNYLDQWHHELGLSLRMKFTFMALRLDVTRNLNTNRDYLGFSLNLIGMEF